VGAVLDAGGGSNSQGGEISAGDTAGTSAGGPSATGSLDTTPFGAPIYTRAERLTNSQFEHSAIDILGLPPTTDLHTGLVPVVLGTTDFSNNEHLLVADSETLPALELAAEKAAALATGSAEALSHLYEGSDAVGFIQQLGRRAFRRPLSDDEAARYLDIFARGEELYGAGFVNGAALVIRAMLASPSFLYRTELGAAGEPLNGYEIASKLSFWLLDTTPSDALLDEAEKGTLDDPEELLSIAGAMLEEPAALEVMRTFHRELYDLDDLDGVVKLGVPSWNAAVNAEAKEASLAFFDGIFARGLGVREILTSTRGFMGPRLAPSYDQSAPTALEERELGQNRKGFFMQAPLLLRDAHDAEPDPIHRGVRLALNVLCVRIGPPAAILPPLPPQKPGETNRERVSSFTAGCGVLCHNEIINPLGFAFEGFDGLGAARDLDHGQPIDASGSFPFSSGQDSFADAAELMTKLADDELPYACYGRKLAGYGLQRDIIPEDQDLIATLAAASRMGAVKDTVLALVADPAFRLRQKDLP
jgi:hypothetical protein